MDVTRTDPSADLAIVRQAMKKVEEPVPARPPTISGSSGGLQAVDPVNVLVVVSDDLGYMPLLQAASARGWLTTVVCSKTSVAHEFQGQADGVLHWEDVYDEDADCDREDDDHGWYIHEEEEEEKEDGESAD